METETAVRSKCFVVTYERRSKVKHLFWAESKESLDGGTAVELYTFDDIGREIDCKEFLTEAEALDAPTTFTESDIGAHGIGERVRYSDETDKFTIAKVPSRAELEAAAAATELKTTERVKVVFSAPDLLDVGGQDAVTELLQVCDTVVQLEITFAGGQKLVEEIQSKFPNTRFWIVAPKTGTA